MSYRYNCFYFPLGIVVEKPSVIEVGGNLESALKGQYELNAIAIIKEAWALTLVARKNINLGILLVFFISLMITLVVTNSLGNIDLEGTNWQAALVCEFLINIVTAPFLAAISLIAIYRSFGVESHFNFVFSLFKKMSVLALGAILAGLLVFLGANLFLFPGLYLFIMLSFIGPIIADKGLSPLNAIVTVLKATRFKWLQIVSVFLFTYLVFILSLMPVIFLMNTNVGIVAVLLFGVSLSYLLPFYFYCKGIIYREIFGMRLFTTQNDQPLDSSFSA